MDIKRFDLSYKFCFIFFAAFFSFQQAQSQISVGSLNKKEKEYFRTFNSLVNYLRKEKTPVISFHETDTYSNEEKFYDKVIDSFFAKDKMLRGFKEDTSIFTVEGKIDMIRHELNGIDIQIDTLAPNSILIKPSRYVIKSNNYDAKNSFSIYVKIGNKKKLLLVCVFDIYTKKILGFIIIGGPASEQ